MKSSRKELKQKAKDQLRGQWTIPVLVTLITGVYSFAVGKISERLVENSGGAMVFSIICTLISAIIAIAVTSFYLKIGRDKKVGFSDLLIEGRTMGKGIGIQLLTTIILIPVTIVAVIIFIIIAIFAFGSTIISYNAYSSVPTFSSGIIWLSILGLLLIAIPIIILGSYFALSVMFLCEDNNRGVWECIKLSFQHIHGNLWRFILLQLSFIGWAILCVFSFGIGYLWLAPYMQVTNINFFNDVTGYDDRNLTTNYSNIDF